MKNNNNFFIQVAPALKDHTKKIEYGLFQLALGKRPKNGVYPKHRSTVRIELSKTGNGILNDVLEGQKDIKSRLEACRLALSIVDESPKHIKGLKKIQL